MTRTKFMFSILLATLLLATQVFAVGAARVTQDTPPVIGTVDTIVLDTDEDTEVTTVVVTLIDELGETHTVRLSLEDATTLGLVENGSPVDPDTLLEPVTIEPDQIIPETPEDTEEEAQHPVGSALSDFFSELLGVDYESIMEYHDDGVGFGVIAQALWMTNALTSDEGGEDAEMTPEELFAAILEAKQNHDYGDITLPDGSTPENWGQFRKAVMQDKEKAKQNLGAIMSGHAENGQGEELQNQEQTQNQEQIQTQDQVQNNGNSPDKNKDKGNNGKGPDKEKNNNGKNNNKGNPH